MVKVIIFTSHVNKTPKKNHKNMYSFNFNRHVQGTYMGWLKSSSGSDCLTKIVMRDVVCQVYFSYFQSYFA